MQEQENNIFCANFATPDVSSETVILYTFAKRSELSMIYPEKNGRVIDLDDEQINKVQGLLSIVNKHFA